jgi:LDH2 family malate/lactate/ureidoglycolate dehydrogenase
MKYSYTDIKEALFNSAIKYLKFDLAQIIAEKIAMAEQMNAPTHGIHYYNRVVKPFLENFKYDFKKTIHGNTVINENFNVVGIINLVNVIKETSILAEKSGVSVGYIKNPGKVGALRVYVPEINANSKTILMFKNTAKSMGTILNSNPIFGTNPFCFGLANTKFIFDSSSTVCATNKLRIMEKKNLVFNHPVGIDENLNMVYDPKLITQGNSSMLPFSHGDIWFKSFYIAMFIEGLSAMAGGFTSSRVGEHKNNRFFSKEGMVIIILDNKKNSNYSHYNKEIKNLVNEVKDFGYRIPGDYKSQKISVYKNDWDALKNI